MKRAALALALAACGSHPPPSAAPADNEGGREPAAPALVMSMKTTPCMGRCPIYELALYSDGRLTWDGGDDAVRRGRDERHVSAEVVTAVIDAFHRARFFELDENTGEVKRELDSVTVCTDTSHTITTFRDGDQVATLDDSHCDEHTLSRLEDEVIALLGIEKIWITPRD